MFELLQQTSMEKEGNTLVSGPLAAHPKDEAPYGTGEDGAKEYAVCRVVAGMPVGCAFAGAVSGLDDRLGQSHIAGNE
jgi:hypothetical protein